MWKCSACAYLWDGEELPEECPKCGAAPGKFSPLDDRAADLVDRARYTNSLHLNLYAVLEQVIGMAEEGVDDNLDGACVKIFRRALDQAEVLQQSILAEIEKHVKAGKWG